MTNDTDRSIGVCLIAFMEFQEVVHQRLRKRHECKARIAVQIAKGRVLNTQIGETVDFKPVDKQPEPMADDVVKMSVKPAEEWFADWQEELSQAIKKRRDGWLRFVIHVSEGTVKGATLNPSFDMKPA